MSDLDALKLQSDMNSKVVKAIIETLVVIVSGVVSVWMLKRELKSGYELII